MAGQNASLDDLLQSLDINIEDTGNNADTGKDKNTEFDLESIPEEHREAVKTALGAKDTEIGGLKNENASQGLAIDKMTQAFKGAGGQKTTEETDTEDEDIFGLGKDDFYAPVFKKLNDGIESIKTGMNNNVQDNWQGDLESFAQKNPDIVRYAKDMDRIVEKHPTMKNDLPQLYKMGKEIFEGREATQKKAREQNDRENNANTNANESGGTGKDKIGAGQASTIADAFEQAKSQLTTT